MFPLASPTWEQGIKITISLLNRSASFFDRLASSVKVTSPHAPVTTAQDHAITQFLLKMSRYSYKVELHLHSIHLFKVFFGKSMKLLKIKTSETRECAL